MPFIEEWEPTYVVLENVTRIKKWDGWTGLLKYLQQAGYHVSPQELDGRAFGVPQSRRRMFILCSLEGPPPKVRADPTLHPATARSILDPVGLHRATPVHGRKRPLAPSTLERIERGRSSIPEDDFLIVYYGSDAAGGWQPLDRPIRTLTTLDRFGLVSGIGRETTLRMLQVPELRRAMGLPDDFQMNNGTRRDKIRLLGNGVCPPVMAAVVGALVKHQAISQTMRGDRIGQSELDLVQVQTGG
jgi:DNA (cytosine-5)-methyltransferase 1